MLKILMSSSFMSGHRLAKQGIDAGLLPSCAIPAVALTLSIFLIRQLEPSPKPHGYPEQFTDSAAAKQSLVRRASRARARGNHRGREYSNAARRRIFAPQGPAGRRLVWHSFRRHQDLLHRA